MVAGPEAAAAGFAASAGLAGAAAAGAVVAAGCAAGAAGAVVAAGAAGFAGSAGFDSAGLAGAGLLPPQAASKAAPVETSAIVMTFRRVSRTSRMVGSFFGVMGQPGRIGAPISEPPAGTVRDSIIWMHRGLPWGMIL